MTITDPRPTELTDEVHALLAQAASDYAAAEPRRRQHLNERYDTQTNAPENGDAW